MIYPGRSVRQNNTDFTTVKSIQRQLNSKGCGPVKVDGDFNLDTIYAVMLFQSRFTDVKGNPLKMDGIVGPVTWTVLFGVQSTENEKGAPNVLLSMVMDIARTQIGVVEDKVGSNSGKEINRYQDAAGVLHGEAWSMAFIYWCFKRACIHLEVPNPVYKTGGVIDLWCNTTAKKIIVADAKINTALVKPGQIFIISTGGGLGHAGFVEKIEGGLLTTVEGNTSTNGCIEGSGVFRRCGRTINSINTGFVEFQ